MSAVQSVYTAKIYCKADQAWIMTLSGFTTQAEKMTSKINVKLYPRRELAEKVHLAYGSGELDGNSIRNISEAIAPGCLGAFYLLQIL